MKVPRGTICSGGTGEVHPRALRRRSRRCADSSTIKRSSSSGLLVVVVVNFGYSQIELDDALGPSSLPSSSIWCQRATPPDVPPSRRPMCHHTRVAIRQLLQGAACPQPHNATPHAAANVASPVKSAAPRAAVRCAGQACRICCRGGRGGSPRAGGWLPLLVSFTACLENCEAFPRW